MSAQSPGLQYSLDGRSWTNPVTNSMFLAELASDQGLAGLLKLQLPPHSLQIFLHEVTHNWTFQSPVGGALALLRMRAERHAYACLAESKGGALGVLEDLSRYQLASELLRPLTEGFAL